MTLIGRITQVNDNLFGASYVVAEQDLSVVSIPSVEDQPFVTWQAAMTWLQSEADRVEAGLVIESVAD